MIKPLQISNNLVQQAGKDQSNSILIEDEYVIFVHDDNHILGINFSDVQSLTNGQADHTSTFDTENHLFSNNNSSDRLPGFVDIEIPDGSERKDHSTNADGENKLPSGNEDLEAGAEVDTLSSGDSHHSLLEPVQNKSLDDGSGSDWVFNTSGQDLVEADVITNLSLSPSGSEVLVACPCPDNEYLIDVNRGNGVPTEYLPSDEQQTFYNEGTNFSAELPDYPLVIEFNNGEENLELVDNSHLYVLDSDMFTSGLGIGLDNNNLLPFTEEVIMVIEDSNNFSLTELSLVYI
ncbi:hemolysin-type calcium-binding protein [Richelia sinica FACHB-800]|uniref:Hemolysin-type calcium-binding protein n=1 Tax=Richelia sinica FACHB-800 TaxID=1357546 RepID=A0A975Y3G5_9NOST|nr:hypothetical protein [Richelia sinica]MBD2664479.1 hypothetical protein [Richelia sinica FACHB-800]QXE22108.1 hemolysin-type calcium-binding protein [Richelia sinica FACHB-800]